MAEEKKYTKGDTKITYTTTRTPGHTRLVATWDNERKAAKRQERIAAQGRREEARKKRQKQSAPAPCPDPNPKLRNVDS